MDDDPYDSTVTDGAQHVAEPKGLRVIVVMQGEAVTHMLPRIGEVMIGRFTGSKLQIMHDTLSRFHATLRIGSTLTIEDHGSANGTFVREQRIPPGQPVPFTPGDVVRVGDVILIFRR